MRYVITLVIEVAFSQVGSNANAPRPMDVADATRDHLLENVLHENEHEWMKARYVVVTDARRLDV